MYIFYQLWEEGAIQLLEYMGMGWGGEGLMSGSICLKPSNDNL